MMNNYGGTSTLGKRNRPTITHSRRNLGNIPRDMSHFSDEELYERNKGVEIEPPSSMEYFSSQRDISMNRYRKQNISAIDSMKESLNIGIAKNASSSRLKPNMGPKLSIESDSD